MHDEDEKEEAWENKLKLAGAQQIDKFMGSDEPQEGINKLYQAADEDPEEDEDETA